MKMETPDSEEMSFLSMFLSGTRRTSLPIAGLMIALIAAADAHAAAEIPLGFLYLVPMLVVGAALTRWEIGGVAIVCAWLAESFDEFAWGPNTGLPRDLLYFSAFFLMGLFMHEVSAQPQAFRRAHAPDRRRDDGTKRCGGATESARG